MPVNMLVDNGTDHSLVEPIHLFFKTQTVVFQTQTRLVLLAQLKINEL